MGPKNSCEKENGVEGKYANYFKIGHNADVFVIDYFQYFPVENVRDPGSKLNKISGNRIITAPADAKQLFEDLKIALAEFEKKNGVIGE